MMYEIRVTNRFKKHIKLCKKRGLNLEIVENAIDLLAESGTLPLEYKEHKLSGDFVDCWECHLKPNWLLIWKQNDNELHLLLLGTGTHSDLS